MLALGHLDAAAAPQPLSGERTSAAHGYVADSRGRGGSHADIRVGVHLCAGGEPDDAGTDASACHGGDNRR